MMATYVTMKEMHTDLMKIQKLIQEGNKVVVVKHSKPIWDIVPHSSEQDADKVYNASDIDQFRFESKHENGNNLATTFDQYIY